jgi:hypothetical protein
VDNLDDGPNDVRLYQGATNLTDVILRYLGQIPSGTYTTEYLLDVLIKKHEVQSYLLDTKFKTSDELSYFLDVILIETKPVVIGKSTKHIRPSPLQYINVSFILPCSKLEVIKYEEHNIEYESFELINKTELNILFDMLNIIAYKESLLLSDDLDIVSPKLEVEIIFNEMMIVNNLGISLETKQINAHALKMRKLLDILNEL